MKIGNLFLQNKTISPEEILLESQKRISYMNLHKIAEQSPVAVFCDGSLNVIYWMYACFLSDRIFSPIPNNLRTEEKEVFFKIKPSLIANEVSIGEIEKNSGSKILPSFNLQKLEELNPIWAIIFSSGTYGQPKPIVLKFSSFFASAMAHAKHNNSTSEDTWLCSMPLYHVGGLSIFTRAIFLEQSVAYEPKFSLESAAYWLGSEKIQALSLVPTMLYRLLKSGNIKPHEKIKTILIGGANFSPELKSAAVESGWPVVETYGLTEATSQVATGGKVLPGFDLKIADDGEIHIRGDALFYGYYGEVPRSRNDFFHTGDIGEFNANQELKILGRKKDIIISGGENIFPQEIENAIREFSKISDCAVCGLQDPEWGEVVAAAFVSDAAINADELKEFLKTKLSSAKIPKRFKQVPSIPSTYSSKLARYKLRELF